MSLSDPVPGLGDDRQRPGLKHLSLLHRPRDRRIANNADAVGVGDEDRTFHESAFLDPRRPGHLAVAVLREPRRQRPDRADALPRGKNDGDTRAHRSFPCLSGPSPRTIVVTPTSTPRTSVMALSGPGVPSNGMPRSRARGLVWANAVEEASDGGEEDGCGFHAADYRALASQRYRVDFETTLALDQQVQPVPDDGDSAVEHLFIRQGEHFARARSGIDREAGKL